MKEPGLLTVLALFMLEGRSQKSTCRFMHSPGPFTFLYSPEYLEGGFLEVRGSGADKRPFRLCAGLRITAASPNKA